MLIILTSLLPSQDLAPNPLAIVLACLPLLGLGLVHANRCVVRVLVPEQAFTSLGWDEFVTMSRWRVHVVFGVFDHVTLGNLVLRMRRL